MIEPAFRILLTANAAVTALVGDRIYFGAAAQNERRARIVMTTTSKVHHHTFQGHAGWVTGRMQIDALAPTYPQAKELAEAIRAAIDSYSGTADDTDISYIEIDEERDIHTAPLAGKAEATHGVSVDARFMFIE